MNAKVHIIPALTTMTTPCGGFIVPMGEHHPCLNDNDYLSTMNSFASSIENRVLRASQWEVQLAVK